MSNEEIEKYKLPKAEIYFYFVSWTFGVLYSLYHVYLIGDRIKDVVPSYYFAQGWSFLNLKKDNYDGEWVMWKKCILEILPVYIIIHHIGAQIIRQTFFHKKSFALPIWYICITSICIIRNIGIHLYIMFLLQPLLFFGILFYVKKSYRTFVIWGVCFTILTTCSYYNFFPHLLGIANPVQIFMATISFMWQNLRCVSFTLCQLSIKKTSFRNFVYFFGYAFYLPIMFFGPIILFEDFFPGMTRNTKNFKLLANTARLLLNTIRYLMWLYFTELALHFIYINVLLQFIEIFAHKSVWLMYGLGYAMGQLFMHKYLIAYGLAITWTKAEGYETPNPPKCVGRIHLCSDLWRYFDEGFYMFIKRYIYEPYLKDFSSTKLWVKVKITFICFAFVYIWHGVHLNIFVWTTLNFFCLVVEMLSRKFGQTKFYNEMQDIMGYDNERRIRAFFCAPLTTLSFISTFYFLGGLQVGNSFFIYLWNGTVPSILCLWFFMYSLCQVSIELRPVFIKKQLQVKKL